MNRHIVTREDCWNLDGVILDFLIDGLEKFRSDPDTSNMAGVGNEETNMDTLLEDIIFGLYVGREIMHEFVPKTDKRWTDFEYSWNLLGKYLFWLWS